MLRKHGFTLVELLVVISIIALLISLILPALQGARFTARVTICSTQTRQWALVGINYATDQRGYFPRFDDPGPNGGANAHDLVDSFFPATESYGLLSKLWWCPLDSRDEATKLAERELWHNAGYNFYIVGYSWWPMRRFISTGQAFPFFGWDMARPYPSTITDPLLSTVPIVTDRITMEGSWTDPGKYYSLQQPTRYASHLRGDRIFNTNLAFADGHVLIRPERDLPQTFGDSNYFSLGWLSHRW